MPRRARPQAEAPTRPGLETLVDDYLAHTRAKGVSPRTLTHYEMVMRKVFLPWCRRTGIADPAQLDQRTLDRFTTALLDDGGPAGPLSRASVRTYASTVNFMLSWARQEGALDGATGRAQLPTRPRRIVDTLDREEITRIEESCTTERDKLIVRLLADTGMRASELLGLRVDDLVREGREHYVRVLGASQGGGAKGDRSRMVGLSPSVAKRLDRYASYGRPPDAADDHVFVALQRSRHSGLYEPLTLSGLGQLIRWAGRRAGIRKPVYPHVFRHSFITWSLRRGINPMTVASIVGHRDLSMIMAAYSHLNQSDAHRALMNLLRDDD